MQCVRPPQGIWPRFAVEKRRRTYVRLSCACIWLAHRSRHPLKTSSSLSSISVEAVLLCLVVVFLTAIFVSCIVVPLYRRRVARRTTPSLRSSTDEEEDAEAHQSLLYPTAESEKPKAVSWWLSLKRSVGKVLGRGLRRNPSRPVAVMQVPMPRRISTPSPSDSYRPSTEPPRSRRSTSSRRGLSIPSPHSPPSSTLPPIPTSPQSPTESLDAAVRLVTNTDPVISFSQYTRPSFDNTRGILVRNHLPTLPPLETLLELPMEEKESSTASRPASNRKRTDDSALALSCVSIPSNLELAPNTHDDQVVQPIERSPSARSSTSSGIFPPSPIIGFSRMSLAKLNTSSIRLSATNSSSPHTPRSTGSRIISSVSMKRKQSTLSLSTPSSQGKTPTPADVTMPLVSASIANTAQVPTIPPPPTINAQCPSSPQSNMIPSPTLPLTTAFNPSSPRRSGTPSSTSTMQIQRWPTVSTVIMGSKDSLPSSTSERDGQAGLDAPSDARVARARTMSEGNNHAPSDIPHTLRPGRARTFQASASHMLMPNITEVDTPSSGELVTSAPRSTHASATSVILRSMSVSGLDSLQAITRDDDEEAVVMKAVPASLQPVRSLPIPPIQTEPPSTSGAHAASPSMEPESHRSEGDPDALNIHSSSAATIMPPRRNSSRAFSPRPLPTPPTTIVPSIPPQPSTSSMFHSSSDLTTRTPPPSELSKYPPSLPHRQSPSTDTLGRPRLHSNTRLSSGYTVQEVHDNLAPAHAASLDITTSLSVPPTEKDIVPSPSEMTAGPSTMTTSPATSSADITARPVSSW